MEPLTGDDPRQVGPYRLLMRLGEGGMGQVYLGRSPGGRTVAVKLVHAGLVGAPGFRERFAREVRASQAVSGTGTAPVVAADPDAVVPWLASAYIPGPSLAEAVHRHGPLPEASLWRLLSGLTEALEVVHASGLVHRDLKPSNVLLSLDRPLLIDFGIARAADGAALTGAGLVVGSPGYMSPEQAEGREATAASDVFSLGAVLAYAATGRDPFGGGSGPESLYRIVHHEPNLTGLPDAFAAIVRECLAKSPEHRPSPTALRARAGAARRDDGADWLPAPVASAIARKAEHLLNLDGEEDAEAVRRRTAVPATPVVTEVDSRPAPDPHAEPTQAAADRGVPIPPPQAVPAHPGPVPSPAYTVPQPDVARTRRHGGGFRALLWVTIAGIAAVTAVAIAANAGDRSTSSGADPGRTSARPTEQATDHSTDPGTNEPTGQVTEAPSPVVGEWRGSYYCAQGQTGLTLTISQDDGDLTATFAFYPIASDPDVARGSFAMRGTYHGTRMRLYGDHWLEQPEGYDMTGLSAVVAGKSPQKITGAVTDADGTTSDNCTTFSVEKG
ncbi:protein kinase domain-containing protein [Streptomyces sp. NPDC004752]